MRAGLLLASLLVVASNLAEAQTAASRDSLVPPPRVPAQSLIDLRDSLQLSDGQLGRLRALARTQAAALTHATASYLRAEADLLDAARKDDIAARRLALEKRAKVGIDGEIARLQGERDARQLLTVDQRQKLQAIVDRTESEPQARFAAAWSSLVAPSPLLRRVDVDSVARDSGQVRLKVTPSYAEIVVDGTSIGTHFKQVSLVVGMHTVTFRAPGCGDAQELHISVLKGQLLIVPPVTIPGC